MGIVHIAAWIHGNTGIAVHKIVELLGSAAEGAYDDAPVNTLFPSVYSPGFHQLQNAVCNHLCVDSQVLLVQEGMGHCIRDCADSQLYGGTVFHQLRHIFS